MSGGLEGRYGKHQNTLLSEELKGSSISRTGPQRQAGENPFNSLVALYILAENETLGLRVKLAGQAELNEQTGQITTSFQNTPKSLRRTQAQPVRRTPRITHHAPDLRLLQRHDLVHRLVGRDWSTGI